MQIHVIGAGAIGLSVAWELASRGHRVTLLDQGNVGRETSWAASGILPAARSSFATEPMERLRGISHESYSRWVSALQQLTGIDPELDCKNESTFYGGLYLASEVGEAASLAAWRAYQQELGVELHLLSVDELASREPQLAAWARSSRFRSALWSPDEYQIRPPRLLKSLEEACRLSGVQVIEQCQVSMSLSDDRIPMWKAVSSSGQLLEMKAEKTILCTGAWTGLLAEAVGLSLSVIPIRGQMLMYRYPQPPMKHVINEGHRYLMARRDGHVLIGSCEEEVGLVKGTTPEMLEQLRQWGESLLPSLADQKPVQSWSGLRPATVDGFPIIGPVPQFESIWVAAGHYRSGIHLAPATAMAVADGIEGQTYPSELAAFSPGRMLCH